MRTECSGRWNGESAASSELFELPVNLCRGWDSRTSLLVPFTAHVTNYCTKKAQEELSSLFVPLTSGQVACVQASASIVKCLPQPILSVAVDWFLMYHLRFHLITILHIGELRSKRLSVVVYWLAELAYQTGRADI
jgi:hypothetical protein